MLTDAEKRDLTTILEFFYGNHATRFKANEKTAQVIWKMLQEAQRCSDAIRFVPLPTATPPGLSYILKNIAQTGDQGQNTTAIQNLRVRCCFQMDDAARHGSIRHVTLRSTF